MLQLTLYNDLPADFLDSAGGLSLHWHGFSMVGNEWCALPQAARKTVAIKGEGHFAKLCCALVKSAAAACFLKAAGTSKFKSVLHLSQALCSLTCFSVNSN